jgi:hypothetical protein
MMVMQEERIIHICAKSLGYAVAQLVEALCYKPEGAGFDSRWGHWDRFSLLEK